ncbi:hypothetical protein [Novosphingobium sp. CF614]|uniref:hypothetical protein n=1 Tax=Novosphingobium sp. CF614 TaxID=1884364 RepID=UPI002100F0DB|nr:hypothetical protein [Novosphingobium sp. CF614]
MLISNLPLQADILPARGHRQNSCQIAHQINAEAFLAVHWRQHDPVDQAAYDLRRLRAVLRIVQPVDEPAYLFVVALGHIGVEQDRRFLRVREQFLEHDLTVFQLPHLVFELRDRRAVGDGIHHLVELAVVAFELGAIAR